MAYLKSRYKFLTGLAVFILVILIAYFVYLLGPVSNGDREIALSISAGLGINEIAEVLKRENLIRSPAMFKVYNFISGSAHLLKPGNYTFASNLGISEIVNQLVIGPEDLKILVTEGKSVKDIESLLVRHKLINRGELANFPPEILAGDYQFLKGKKNLEGFLFPDTYRISPGSSKEVIVRKFMDNFKEKIMPVLSDNGELTDHHYDKLILASLIEREIPLKEERPLIAGILEKRLKIGMPLQVDATVVYAKCKGGFDPIRDSSTVQSVRQLPPREQLISDGVDSCPFLTKSDFKIKSTYNTYYVKGLPPTPIANPGIDAILAALNPKSSKFLYYLSNPETKETIFSRTLKEHELRRARYLSR